MLVPSKRSESRALGASPSERPAKKRVRAKTYGDQGLMNQSALRRAHVRDARRSCPRSTS